MSKWRRVPMIVLALWAASALTMPTLVWSCPITGRLSATPPICAESKSAAPKAASHKPCCPQPVALPAKPAPARCHPQSVPLPQAPHEAVFPIPALQNPALTTTHAPQIATVAVLINAPLRLAPSFSVSRSFDAADPLHIQHSPPRESGRAPPL